MLFTVQMALAAAGPRKGFDPLLLGSSMGVAKIETVRLESRPIRDGERKKERLELADQDFGAELN